MKELIKAVCKALNDEGANVNFNTLKISIDEDGNITIKNPKPKKSKYVEKVKAEIDSIEDDIFDEAAAKLKKLDFASFKVLSTLDDDYPDEKAIAAAYKVFKVYVKEVAENKVTELTKRASNIFDKYLDEKTL